MIINGLSFLTPSEALPLLESNAVLVDLRDDYYKNGREFNVLSLVSLFYKDLETNYNILSRDKLLNLADYVGLHSKEAGHFLLSKGYTQVASLIGGIVDWVKDGMPTKIDHSEELVGGCACQLKKRKLIKT
jgi:rhodanese-related sulfurtransferase